MHGGYLDFINHYCSKCLTASGKKKIAHLEHEVNLGNITENEFYRQIRQVFGVELTAAQMHKLIVAKMKTDKGLAHLIPHLKKAKIALFTNSIGHMAIDVLKARRYPVKKIFDKLFISSRIHLAKPDAKAYQYVVKKLRVKPEEALMVDDRRENIVAAKKIGMQGIVYKNSTQFRKELSKFQLV